MAEAEGGINVETQHISMQMSALPRDLLQTVISTGNHFPGKCEVKQEKLEVEEDEEEIELSLGLSLNGRFGVDPTASTKMKLTRSSSLKPEFMNLVKKEEKDSPAASGFPQAATMMSRACSLPVETEEEWRKRKEIQSLRRMEAKRKRTEKQRNSYFRGAKDEDRAELEDDCEEGVMPINGNYKYMKVLNEFSNSGSPNWVGGGRGFGSCEIESKGERSRSNGFEVLSPQGMNKCTESRSPANMQPLLDQSDQKPAVTPATGTATEKPGACTGAAPAPAPTEKPGACTGAAPAPAMPAIKNPTVGQNGTEEMVRDVMLGMPCVTTKGDGPNGKRIQGLLYPYRKGENVRIVCVCHGSFLSPAEFVKHGGGGDVENPLKHIVVNPSSLL